MEIVVLGWLFIVQTLTATRFRWEYVVVDDGEGLSQQGEQPSDIGAPGRLVLPSFPSARSQPGMAALGSKIYLHAGYRGALEAFTAELWSFSTLTDRWSFELMDLPDVTALGTMTRNAPHLWDERLQRGYPASRYRYVLLSFEDQITAFYCWGGGGPLGVSNDLWSYDGTKWRLLSGDLSEVKPYRPDSDPEPTSSQGAAGWVVDQDLFVWGGLGCLTEACSSYESVSGPIRKWVSSVETWEILDNRDHPPGRAYATTWTYRPHLMPASFTQLYLFSGLTYYGQVQLDDMPQDLHCYFLGNSSWKVLASSYNPLKFGNYSTTEGYPGARYGGASFTLQYGAIITLGVGLASSAPTQLIRVLGDTFFYDTEADVWSWVDVYPDETTNYDGEGRYFASYPPSEVQRPGQRYAVGYTFHARSRGLYVYGGWKSGPFLDLWRLKVLCTDGRFARDPLGCSGRGSCDPILSPECVCSDPLVWGGDSCQLPVCFGLTEETGACDSHGICIAANNCTCLPDYRGPLCNNTVCFGQDRGTSAVCGGPLHGDCWARDECLCSPSWTGVQCHIPACYGIAWNDSLVCSSHGSCLRPTAKCDCDTYYESSSFCDVARRCFGDEWNASDVCRGHGICLAMDSCECSGGWLGAQCTVAPADSSLVFVLLGAVGCLTVCICLIVAVAVIILLYCSFGRRFGADIQTDSLVAPLLFGETELDSVASMRFRIDPELDSIPSDHLILKNRLGSGGSGTVYMAELRGIEVAGKVCFLSEISSQDELDRMTLEAKIMRDLSHPNVLKLFGVNVQFPTLCLVTEFCPAGDVKSFLVEHAAANLGSRFSSFEKRRWLEEIARGMEYLHAPPREIIHRDLKPQNVLLDSMLVCKIGDFGLAFQCKQIDERSKTKGIGTSRMCIKDNPLTSLVYMAPELVVGKDYDHAVDVYAFGILAFVILSENFRPLGEESSFVAFRAASDPSFRPNTGDIEDEFPEMAVLVCRCWESEADERLSFTEILDALLKQDDD